MSLEPPPQPIQVREIHHYHKPASDPGVAVILELLPGVLCQTFGIGNIYAGNVAGGIAMMVGYWILTVINVFLCFVMIGFVTLPLTWIGFMIFCPMMANDAAKRRRGY